jgi:hypothetical protein
VVLNPNIPRISSKGRLSQVRSRTEPENGPDIGRHIDLKFLVPLLMRSDRA